MLPVSYWIVGLATICIVVICVTLHYEGLKFLSDKLSKPQHHQRSRIVWLILSILFLHVLEIWVFACGYYTFVRLDGFGGLSNLSSNVFYDCVYFSASSFTTIGFGDIVPTGALRTMTGMEGISGLTLITWSASYTFVEMLKTWEPGE